MIPKRTSLLLAVLIVFAFLINACGPSASNQSIIATSVAMTIQAQNTQQAQPTPTNLPLPGTEAPVALTPTLGISQAPPTAPPTGGAGSNLCTASASLAGETIPDGTIVNPGDVFTKIWHITNTGTCTWDSTWKLVYVSGDLLGAAGIFNFPQPAAPGQTVDVPIVLTAPQNPGTYTGYWKLESRWGTVFGVGDNNSPFWVSIVVGSGTPANNKTETAYGITAVTYSVTRDPVAGCATNVRYNIAATISSNGPIKITYHWLHSDGPTTNKQTITFTEASSQTVIDGPWAIHLGSRNGTYWDQLIVTDPTYQAWDKATFDYLCH